ncbi:CopG family ribbon-helix-helix protein [Pectobacterium carotovorum]|uniref:CopG family ribbon-helix-helix protein n=1 Tax=Pectobacterium carotovorum TaxID=554 RepID=UPI000AD9F026|nr:hypothetical protein [Pectobacterium carotovorum]
MLAKVTGCTHSFLAGQAIEDYLAREAWQIAEIEQAIKEADADDFVSSDDDEQFFKKIRQGKSWRLNGCVKPRPIWKPSTFTSHKTIHWLPASS